MNYSNFPIKKIDINNHSRDWKLVKGDKNKVLGSLDSTFKLMKTQKCRKVWLDKRGRDIFSGSFQNPTNRIQFDKTSYEQLNKEFIQQNLVYQHLITFRNRGQQTDSDESYNLLQQFTNVRLKNQREFELIVALIKAYFYPNSDSLLEHNVNEIHQFCDFLSETFPTYFPNHKVSTDLNESERSPILCTNDIDGNVDDQLFPALNEIDSKLSDKRSFQPSTKNEAYKPSKEINKLPDKVDTNQVKPKSYESDKVCCDASTRKECSDKCKMKPSYEPVQTEGILQKNKHSILTNISVDTMNNPFENLKYKHPSIRCSFLTNDKVINDTHNQSENYPVDPQMKGLLMSLTNLETNMDLSPKVSMIANEFSYHDEINRVRQYLNDIQMKYLKKAYTDEEYENKIETAYKYVNEIQFKYVQDALTNISLESKTRHTQSEIQEITIDDEVKVQNFLKVPIIRFIADSTTSDTRNEEINHYMKFLNAVKIKYLTKSISKDEYNEHIDNFCQNINKLQTESIIQSMQQLSPLNQDNQFSYIPKSMSVANSANEEIHKFTKYLNCAKIRFIKTPDAPVSFNEEINKLSQYLNELNMNYLQEGITAEDYDTRLMWACRQLNEIQTMYLSSTISTLSLELTPKFSKSFADQEYNEILENVCKYIHDLQIKHLNRTITNEQYDDQIDKICKHLNDLNVKYLSDGVRRIETDLLPNYSKALTMETVDENMNKIIKLVKSPKIRYITQSITNDEDNNESKKLLKTPRIKYIVSKSKNSDYFQSKDGITPAPSALNNDVSALHEDYDATFDKVCKYLNELKKKHSSKKMTDIEFDDEVYKVCQYLSDIQVRHVRHSIMNLDSPIKSNLGVKFSYLHEPIGAIENEATMKSVKSELNNDYNEELERICDYLNKVRHKHSKHLTSTKSYQQESKKILNRLNRLQINFLSKSFNIFESLMIYKFLLNYNNKEDLNKVCSCINNSQISLINRVINEDITAADTRIHHPQIQFIVKPLNSQEFKKDFNKIYLHLNNVISKYNEKLNEHLIQYFNELKIKMITIIERDLITTKSLTNEIYDDDTRLSNATDNRKLLFNSMSNAETDVTYHQLTKSLLTEDANDDTMSTSHFLNSELSLKNASSKQKYAHENDMKLDRLFNFESKATSASTILDFDFTKPIEFRHNKLEIKHNKEPKHPKENKSNMLEKHKLDQAIPEEIDDDRSLRQSLKYDEEQSVEQVTKADNDETMTKPEDLRQIISPEPTKIPEKPQDKMTDNTELQKDEVNKRIDSSNYENNHEKPSSAVNSIKFNQPLICAIEPNDGTDDDTFMDIYKFKMNVNPHANVNTLMSDAYNRNVSMRTQDGKSGIHDESSEKPLSALEERASAIILVNFDGQKGLSHTDKNESSRNKQSSKSKNVSNDVNDEIENNDLLVTTENVKEGVFSDENKDIKLSNLDRYADDRSKTIHTESEDDSKRCARNPVNMIGSVIYDENTSKEGFRKPLSSKGSIELDENYYPVVNEIESQQSTFTTINKNSKLDDQQIRKFQYEPILETNGSKTKQVNELSTINELEGQTTTRTNPTPNTADNITESYCVDGSQLYPIPEGLKASKKVLELKLQDQNIEELPHEQDLIKELKCSTVNTYSDIYDDFTNDSKSKIQKPNWKLMTENYFEQLTNNHKILTNIINDESLLSIVIFLIHESLYDRIKNDQHTQALTSDLRTDILTSKDGIFIAVTSNNEAMEIFSLNIAHFMNRNCMSKEILGSMKSNVNEFTMKLTEDIDLNIKLAFKRNQIILNLLDFVAYAAIQIDANHSEISKSKCHDDTYFNPKKSTLATKILCVTFSWIRNNELEELGYEKLLVDDKTVSNAEDDLLVLKNWLKDFIDNYQDTEEKLELFKKTKFYIQYLQYSKFVQKRSTDVALNELMGSPDNLLTIIDSLAIDSHTVRQAIRCCLKQLGLKWVHDSEEEHVSITLDTRKLTDELSIKQLIIVIIYWGINNDLTDDPNSVDIKANPNRFFTDFDFEKFKNDLLSEDCDFPLILDEFFVRVKIYCSSQHKKRIDCPLDNLKLMVRQLNIDEFIVQCMDDPPSLLELLRSTKKWIKKYLAAVNTTPNQSLSDLNMDIPIVKEDISHSDNHKESSHSLTSVKSDEAFKDEVNDHNHTVNYNRNRKSTDDGYCDNENNNDDEKSLKKLNTNNSSVENYLSIFMDYHQNR